MRKTKTATTKQTPPATGNREGECLTYKGVTYSLEKLKKDLRATHGKGSAQFVLWKSLIFLAARVSQTDGELRELCLTIRKLHERLKPELKKPGFTKKEKELAEQIVGLLSDLRKRIGIVGVYLCDGLKEVVESIPDIYPRHQVKHGPAVPTRSQEKSRGRRGTP